MWMYPWSNPFDTHGVCIKAESYKVARPWYAFHGHCIWLKARKMPKANLPTTCTWLVTPRNHDKICLPFRLCRVRALNVSMAMTLYHTGSCKQIRHRSSLVEAGLIAAFSHTCLECSQDDLYIPRSLYIFECTKIIGFKPSHDDSSDMPSQGSNTQKGYFSPGCTKISTQMYLCRIVSHIRYAVL